MSKKYVIDLPDDAQYILINGASENHCYTRVEQVDDLEELNSDYINENFGSMQDEAYQRGLAEGKKAFDLLDAERNADYQRGLDDAMNAFKKLYSCGWERDWKAMGFEFDDGEWSSSFEYIIGHYTAAEIVEKVKAYKDKKIHVGDFVSHNNVSEIIVLVTYVGCNTFNEVAITDVEDHCRKGESYTYCASEDWHKVNMQLVKGEDNA